MPRKLEKVLAKIKKGGLDKEDFESDSESQTSEKEDIHYVLKDDEKKKLKEKK